MDSIKLRQVTEGPLKGIDLELGLGQLICLVGRAGSGSRALGVDVLWAESRRRYLMALSAFERERLGGLPRVEVEEAEGLPPAMCFGRGWGRGSQVGTLLQIEVPLARLWLDLAEHNCPACGGACRAFSAEEAAFCAAAVFDQRRCLVLAPMELEHGVDGVIAELKRAGFLRIRHNGKVVHLDRLAQPLSQDGHLAVVVDRLTPGKKQNFRLIEAVRSARAMAQGRCLLAEAEGGEQLWLNQQLTCQHCGQVYRDLSVEDFGIGGKERHPVAAAATLAEWSIEEWHRRPLGELLGRLQRYFAGQPRIEQILPTLEEANKLGVGYLALKQKGNTISTGERQRLLLASCLHRGLVGMLYVFDRPTLGLEGGDLASQLAALTGLVRQGNTVIALDDRALVVAAADKVIVFEDGCLVADQKLPDQQLCPRPAASGALKSPYLHLVESGKSALGPLDLKVPLGALVAISGPSGCGKSTLLRFIGQQGKRGTVSGGRSLRRLVQVDEEDRGRQRTLIEVLGLAGPLARLFARTPGATHRKFPPEWFSIERPGGRCPVCEGKGELHYDLQFLEDVALVCSACGGKRFKEEVLEIALRGLDLGDIFALTLEEAAGHFGREGDLAGKIEAALLGGLGQRRLGAAVDQLEAGEFLRARLVAELERLKDRDVLLVDYPIGSEHPDDCNTFVRLLKILVQAGGSVVVAGGEPAVVAAADWVIELAPGTGRQGGVIAGAGAPLKG